MRTMELKNHKNVKKKEHIVLLLWLHSTIFLFDTLSTKIVLCEHKSQMLNQNVFTSYFYPTVWWESYHENSKTKRNKKKNVLFKIGWKTCGIVWTLWPFDLPVPQIQNCLEIRWEVVLCDCTFNFKSTLLGFFFFNL